MSRSYKHTPYCGLKKSEFYKNYANRKLRRQKLAHNYQHMAYKKNSCSYDICDWYELPPKNFHRYYKEAVSNWLKWSQYSWYKDEPCPTKEECWQRYQKWFIRK